MRGYNLSSQPKNRIDYRMSLLVRDVRRIIEKLNYNKAILVAHDWGGVVAWSFAYVCIRNVSVNSKLSVTEIPRVRRKIDCAKHATSCRNAAKPVYQ